VSVTGRAKKVLDRFPAFMRLDEPGKTLGAIATALGGDADKAEVRLGGIMAARRVRLAREETDLLSLAASLGLETEDFLLLTRGYEAGLYASDDPEATPEEAAQDEYDAYLDDLRAAIERCADVMLDGCGTIWALLEGSSLLLGAENGGIASLEHPDAHLPAGGFLHRVRIGFEEKTAEGWEPRENWLYLRENPLVEKEAGPFEARQRRSYQARRGGFFNGSCDGIVGGTTDRTVKLLVINRGTREGHGFRGLVPDGVELKFARDGKVYLDEVDVTEQAYRFHGALFDDENLGFVTVEPEGAMDRNFPRPAVVGQPELPAPRLLLGDNAWRFSVEEGAFDASAFDECVFAFPKPEEDILALPPSGELAVAWREHKAFSVEVRLPPEIRSWEGPLLSGDSLTELLRRGLERFRAAGIELIVDYFDEDWLTEQGLSE
jgi:hypothetical protein